MSNNKAIHEYRCTRNSPYMHECFGKNDLGARQGHYVNASSELEAMEIMAKDFPKDRHGFTATLWQENIHE